MLLRNFPMLGGYTQRVRPGAHPVLDLQQRRTFLMSTEGLRSVRKGSTRPSGVQGLDGGRSMYLPAEWGPRIRETTLLGELATTTRRAGLGCA